ncbi:Planctomycete cytochrome C [Zobellia uliginosa]|uniref:Planctomycete cytochrome C n=2 Tax=Zobellia uliginosa TaxID=143224 RepID=A0ABY1L570_9FLAO|nr:Planctomycete cytochrome C [Zobellia uliginosa]
MPLNENKLISLNRCLERTKSVLFVAFLILMASACSDKAYEKYADVLPEKVDFNYHIKPILSDRCFTCHGPDKNGVKAGLRLDIPEGALKKTLESGGHAFVPGSIGKSRAYQRMVSDDPELRMPPPKFNLSMTEFEIAMIAKWIDQGAEYKPHWSYASLKKTSVPKVKNEDWLQNPIDNFVLKKLENNGLKPNVKADKELLLRRLSLDLTGLPPTIDEIDDFMADDSDKAYEKVVDRLLSSSHYGERMAVEWLDIARYADSHGYSTDGVRTMWPWRDWVIDAFNSNMPYNDFITWQVAGDKFPNATREQKLATAFLRNQKLNAEGGIVLEEFLVEYAADRAETVSTAFLGLTMQCAKCHDHKYDQISQKEYFQFFSFFNSVNERGMTPNDGNSGPQLLLTTKEVDDLIAYIDFQVDSLQKKLSPLKRSLDVDKYSHPKLDLNDGLLVDISFENSNSKKVYDASRAQKTYEVGGEFEPVKGKKGKGFKFTGYDVLRINDTKLDFGVSDPFSFSFWVNSHHENEYMPLLMHVGGKNDNYKGYEMTVLNGYPSIRLINSLPANMISVRTEKPLAKDEWVHLTFVYDGSGSASGIQIYSDGKKSKKQVLLDELTKAISRGNGRMTLGGKIDYQVEVDGFGLMDDLKIYNRELSEVEAFALFEEAKVAPDNFSKEALKEHYLLTESSEQKAISNKIKSLRKEKNTILDTVPTVMIMGDLKEPRPTYILDRGAYDIPLEEVSAGTPEDIFPFTEEFQPDRLGLANWLVDERNPLTARVTVNRYWQLLFGQGIVKTVEDFGNQGALPHHPELLDYLAKSFIDSGWDVKKMMKTIVMSATYQQSSRVPVDERKDDPDNEMLARGPSNRLQGEFIRDLALASSGLLVDEIGGASVKPYQPEGLWEEITGNSVYLRSYREDEGDKLYRRSLYTFWRRASPPPTMTIFDAPSRDYCIVKRAETNTPLQALSLLNDPQFVEAARVLAERVVRDKRGIREQIVLAYRLLTGISPDKNTIQLLEEHYAKEKVRFENNPREAKKLLALGYTPVKMGQFPVEVAAMTVVCNTIMSFDETIMKR